MIDQPIIWPEPLLGMALGAPALKCDGGLPRVLVLLATCNGTKGIARQIDSVLAQQGVNILLNVRDDGSNDGSAEQVARLAAADTRIHLLPDRTPSGSAAGNFFALMREAQLTGVDYVAFCDQDDEWFPTKLRRAVDHLRRSGCRGYSGAVRAFWPGGRVRLLAQCPNTSDADYLFEGAGQGCTFVFDADEFGSLQRRLNEAGPLLRQVHYHDWLTYALTRAAGEHWYFDSDPTMRYYQHAGNDTGARTSLAGIARRLRLLRGGWYRDQVNAVTAVVHRLHPEDSPTARWLGISSRSCPWWRRFVFVALHGRRRLLDRLIQLLAILLGHL